VLGLNLWLLSFYLAANYEENPALVKRRWKSSYLILVVLLESHFVGKVPELTPVTFAETNLPNVKAVSFSDSPVALVIGWQVLGTV
jgi:hypothetical protein